LKAGLILIDKKSFYHLTLQTGKATGEVYIHINTSTSAAAETIIESNKRGTS
jgi:hypothetical protein